MLRTWFSRLVCLAGCLSTCSAINIIGYYNVNLVPGQNFIANQLIATPDQTLNSVLTYGVPDGATFTEWNAATHQFLPLSTFSAATTNWSVNYTFDLGQGGILNALSGATVTFVGGVPLYTNIISEGPGELWAPNYANGMHLIASPDPVSGGLSTLFYDVTGRQPLEGERVGIPGSDGSVSSIATFLGGAWDQDLVLSVGQSAWFDLGGTGISGGAFPMLADVPEPATWSLLGLGASIVLARRRRVRGN